MSGRRGGAAQDPEALAGRLADEAAHLGEHLPRSLLGVLDVVAAADLSPEERREILDGVRRCIERLTEIEEAVRAIGASLHP